uniref:Oxidation resistance protein 1 n=1 Tax=Parastrongyloides trichosuri TaxID=131310 RepID=A0A0N4ZSS7_PARTI
MPKGDGLLSNFMGKINISVNSLSSVTSPSPNGSSNPLSSVLLNASNSLSPNSFVGSHVRRLSMPIQEASKSGIRRFSQMMTVVNQALDIEENAKDEKQNTPFFGGNSLVNREWEIVTVGEMCRRLSIEDSLQDLEMPLPEGSTASQILDDFMIRQIADILPPRAEGYPWVSVFSSEKHGFSLSTLYRKMAEFGEEMSPILIVIRDTRGHVFGAVVSTPVYPCEHYYGTGDSCLLFRFTGEYPHTRELRHYTWTGDNQFFINATKDFLSVGAGQGHYGLWLDADLNNGISQKCQTFNNELLAGGEQEEFVLQFIEAFGFSM